MFVPPLNLRTNPISVVSHTAEPALHCQLSARARQTHHQDRVRRPPAFYQLSPRLIPRPSHSHSHSMDSFQPCARLMLKELHVLLQRTPTVFASTRLVQLMALNMFSIHNLRARGESLSLSLSAVLFCFGFVLLLNAYLR